MVTLQDFVQVCLRSGKFFSVTFLPRTPGKGPRRMLCRGGVRKYVSGKGAGYSFREKDLLPVWEPRVSGRLFGSRDASGYRSIPLDGILEVRGMGQVLRRGV